MRRSPEVPPEEPAVSPDVLVEQVAQAAEEIAHSLEDAGDDTVRRELLHTVAEQLMPQDVRLVDTHSLAQHSEVLNGRRGQRTGRTRDQVLADIALIRLVRRRQSARRGIP